AMISSTVSSESAPRSSRKEAWGVICSSLTFNWLTMISLTRCSIVFCSAMLESSGRMQGSHRHAAVNGKNLARDIVCFLGTQKGRHVRHIGRLAEALQGDQRLRALLDILGQNRGHVGANEAGSHHIGRH